MEDLFISKNIKPMLIGEMESPFDSPDYIYEIKFDGIRCIAYLDENETDIRNKRNKLMIPIVPELSNLHKQAKSKCIIDGELVVLKDGMPDFFEIQRRALMSDPFKIKLSGSKYPASFVAYDILYYKDKQILDYPLMERKALLEKTVIENNSIAISRYIENNGIQLYNLTKERNLEGIVAKKKQSLYWLDKRTKDWIKCKVMASIDCVICGYIRKENNMASIIIGQYDQEHLVYRGHVTMGVGLRYLNKYKYEVLEYPPFEKVPPGNEDAVWLKPTLVCIVEYMPNEKNTLRQPVFKGIRDDKLPKECQIHDYQII